MSEILPAPPSQTTPVWIGEGRSGCWTDYDEAMRDCGLDYTAKTSPIMTPRGKTASNHQAVIDEQTGSILGIVSNNYSIIQNAVAFNPMRELLASNEFHAEIIAGGVASSGLNFMVARVSEFCIGVDRFSMDVFCTNSFNGAFAMQLAIIPRRLICNNQFRGILRGNKRDAIFRVNHTSQGDRAAARLSAHIVAVTEVTAVQHQFEGYVRRARAMELPPAEAEELVRDAVFNGRKNDLTDKQKEIREQKAKDFMELYYHNMNNHGYVGTAMGLVNAYFDYLCHAPAKSGKRLTNMLDGTNLNTGWLRVL